MKIAVISDTHMQHNYLPELPKGVDMVIHAGDGTNIKDPYRNEIQMRDFLHWFKNLKCEYKVFVPGNHDTSLEAGLIKKEDYPEVDILINETVILEGLIITGSSYTPAYGFGWAWNKRRVKLDRIWKNLIPDDVDILVTHGPPKGILDHTWNKLAYMESVGCKSLLNRIKEMPELKYHIFGHLHDEPNIINSAILERDEVKFVNASFVDIKHKPVNKWKVIII